MFRHRLTSVRRWLVVVGAVVLVLTGCGVQVDVVVVMDDQGAGTVTVTVVADAELAAAAPGLADDVRTADLVEAGWDVEGPVPTDDGGLELVLSTDFASPEEANRALAQLSGAGGPFVDLRIDREVEGRDVSYGLDGTLTLVDGLEAFADDELVELVGGAPYTDVLAERGISLDDALDLTLTVQLPGEVRKTTGTETSDGLRWTVPVDGSSQSVVTATVDEGPSNAWGIIATILLVVLGLWVAAAGTFILYVALARRRRAARRRTGRPPSAAPRRPTP